MHVSFHHNTSHVLVFWMSVIFIVGSACFGGAAIAFLLPSANDVRLNWVFFVGSIFFTIAGYLQLLDATNQRGQSQSYFAWRPQNVGYLAAFTQWVGMLIFNINTIDATLGELSWVDQDLLIWTPNLVGSILFVVSAFYLLKDIDFRFSITDSESSGAWTNLLGCAAFMVSALCSIYLPSEISESVTNIALLSIALGGLCFLSASALTLVRLRRARSPL